jgi:dTDP-4-dehydrorhamnose 3,5-epimerase
MKRIEAFGGLKIIEAQEFRDDRGYFFESWNDQVYKDYSIFNTFVQDNESGSVKGVIRGLHYQLPPFAQAKLVRAVYGTVLDVVVDIRPDSDSYGDWFSIILDQDEKKQLFIPAGFAHGFSVLSDYAIFSYKCDQFYNKQADRSINPLDQTLEIDWMIPTEDMKLSEKDLQGSTFSQHEPFR